MSGDQVSRARGICAHNNLARSCEMCERDAEIARLEARVRELDKEYMNLQNTCTTFEDDSDKLIALLSECAAVINEMSDECKVYPEKVANLLAKLAPFVKK